MSGIKIGSNISSLTVQRYLEAGSLRLSNSFEKLSSGMRINKASDDAAGLAISSSLNADVRVLGQGIRNLNDGISLAMISEGALGELKNISLRQRELATQAANGSYTIQQRQAMNTEANKLVEEYNRIIQTTAFNGTRLFGSNPHGIRIQAGEGTDGSLVLGLGGALSRNVGDGTFQARNWFSTGSNPISAKTADFNGDGKLDISVVNMTSGTVSVLLGNGDGTFQANQDFTVGASPYIGDVSDFNNDGKLDFATVDYMSAEITILLGNGNGTFRTLTAFTCGGGPSSVTAGDFNGDGRMDLVTADTSGNTVDVFLGSGNGTFGAKHSFTSGINPLFTEVGDFNGDNIADIAASNQGEDTLGVLLGKGDGTFQAVKVFTTGATPEGLAISDYNGDGRADIVTSDYGSDALSVFLGNGDGTFAKRRVVTVGPAPIEVEAADMNGDGRMDLIATENDSSTVSVLLGNGDGTFGARRAVTAGASPQCVAIGDLDGDERPDIITSDFYDGTVSVLLANKASTCASQYLNLNTRKGALDAMPIIDGNLQRIQNELGAIGATTSRFEVALSTLRAARENETAASSRITDADIASETAAMVKNQIVQQAAASVLAQANQSPALALTLLR